MSLLDQPPGEQPRRPGSKQGAVRKFPATGDQLRLRALVLLFAFLFLAIGLRLFDLVPHDLKARELEEAERAKIQRQRATIVDRNGSILATDILMPAMIMDPLVIRDPIDASKRVAAVIEGVDQKELAEKLSKQSRFALVRHKLSPEEQATALRIGLPGINFRPLPHRAYPAQELAAHIIGAVNIDNKGMAGVEYGLNDRLLSERDAPLALTIDLRVQRIVHQALGRALKRFKSIGACAIVLDQRNGDLISLVSLPDFDPNRYGYFGDEEKINRCTGSVYELGSLFKVPTTAMALESGAVDLYDWFDAVQPIKLNGHRIRDHHPKKRSLSTPEVFIFSSNIGTAKMAMQAGGADVQRPFLEKIGMFKKPVLPIPEIGRPLVPQKWIEVTAATVAFGHSLAVSPLQLADAVAAISGDGSRVPPRLLMTAEIPERERWVDKKTADDMRWLMWLNVEKGTGHYAGSDEYLVGGKTGTAEKPRTNGRGYQWDKVLSSFVATFPIEDPRYVVFVMLDEPHGDKGTGGTRYGSMIAAPVVGEIIKKAGPVLGVHPSEPESAALFSRRLVETKIWNAVRGRQEDSFAALPVR